MSRTAINGALYPLRAGKVVIPSAFNALRHLAELPGKLAGGVALDTGPRRSGSLFAPTTRFNDSATPHRAFEARFHDLADFKRIKACVPDATINDVALAYVGGALRRYLEEHGELPDATLVAACPASIRDSSEQGSGGNRLFGRLQSLETLTADPLERLASIVERDRRVSRQLRFVEQHPADGVGGNDSHHAAGADGEGGNRMPFSGPTIANTTVSNVPGPTEPVFFAGARLVRVTGLGPLIGGMNLFHVIASYNGTVSMGVTADRDALPDPANYADCMQAAFEDLLAAAG